MSKFVVVLAILFTLHVGQLKIQQFEEKISTMSTFFLTAKNSLKLGQNCLVWHRYIINLIWKIFKNKHLWKRPRVRFLNSQLFFYLFWSSADCSYMADIEFKRKDKRSKLKKLKLFSSTAPNSKVRPQTSLECSNSSIQGSGTKQAKLWRRNSSNNFGSTTRKITSRVLISLILLYNLMQKQMH